MEIILSVSQLNDYVQGLFGHDPLLRRLRVRGEISGLKALSSHTYFTLKDDAARVACVVFNAGDKTAGLADGMRAVVTGHAALYVQGGQYQLNVQSVEVEGQGEWFLRFAALQQKLAKLGWFDESRKRPLPRFPKCIGVATSLSGAVIRDIIAVGTRRWPLARLLFHGAQVQGAEAPEQLVLAIHALERTEAEVIVVARGGGSAEDLAAFNDEALAKAIAECRVPVVSAVGHETDYTIADFVADVRAPTPSAAMEICLPDAGEMRAAIHSLRMRLVAAASVLYARRREQLSQLRRVIAARKPQAQLRYERQALQARMHALCNAMRNQTALRAHRLEALLARMRALSAGEVLGRGYTLVVDEDNAPVTSASRVAAGQTLRVRWHDGEAVVTVDEVTPV